MTGILAGISDHELVRRAVAAVKPKRGQPKYTAVMKVFGIGSSYAAQLCDRLGFDPDETRKK